MTQKNDPARNRPTEEGRKNDPSVRDDSAIQPGVQTNSDSDFDEANQNVTLSSMDDSNITEYDIDDDADATFDDIEDDE
jgi:hypothetical protein